MNDQWIKIHNVYSAFSDSYVSRFTLSIVKTLERQLHDSEKHIVLKNFNLHHFLWNDFSKFTQHDATNQLLNVVHRTQFRFTFSFDTVTWETKQTCSIIDLIFMFEELRNELMHCMTRSKLNQSSNHISIFTKIMLAIKLKTERQSRAWKKIDVEKLNNNWQDLVVLSSLICREHVEEYAIRIKQSIKSAINETISWNKSSFETKFFWNDRCANVVTTIKRKRREWTATHTKKVWRTYLRPSNEKKKVIAKKKSWNFEESFALFVIRRRISNVSFSVAAGLGFGHVGQPDPIQSSGWTRISVQLSGLDKDFYPNPRKLYVTGSVSSGSGCPTRGLGWRICPTRESGLNFCPKPNPTARLVSFVDRSLKVIDQERYSKYLTWFAEISKKTFSNMQKISNSIQDF